MSKDIIWEKGTKKIKCMSCNGKVKIVDSLAGIDRFKCIKPKNRQCKFI